MQGETAKKEILLEFINMLIIMEYHLKLANNILLEMLIVIRLIALIDKYAKNALAHLLKCLKALARGIAFRFKILHAIMLVNMEMFKEYKI